MLISRYFNRLYNSRACLCNIKSNAIKRNKSTVEDNNLTNSNNNRTTENGSRLGNMSSKYRMFQENESEVILDVYEEKLKYARLLEDEISEDNDPLLDLNFEHGENGVFEIEDLVDVLRRENSEDIFVAKVPNEIKYVDYICIVSGKSPRHMQAIAQFVRRVYKLKQYKSDLVPKLEGKDSTDWMALDLGNIALHIFSKSARRTYDLDSLWALGSSFDDEYNKKEPVSEMLEKHSLYLKDLEPAT